MLQNKTFGGNVALKFDIRKAFDTLDWKFLLSVLSKFRFHNFCELGFCNLALSQAVFPS